ncbi:WhiB family transcriptional regulator [Rhodococcus sp. 077-4]|uniref:WhiB family transcriptional regulator n=1 Tax=Rhodococcus sp. 077-4 TaxID=2789271 RepID=UPI0039F5BB7F
MKYKPVDVHLPPPITGVWEWQLQARCRTMPISLFYPDTGLRGPTLRHLEEEAKAICHQCPVLDTCRSHAERSIEPYGIWGGLTERERATRHFEEPSNRHR